MLISKENVIISVVAIKAPLTHGQIRSDIFYDVDFLIISEQTDLHKALF